MMASLHLMRRQLSARIALIVLRTTATGHSDGTVTIWGSMRTNFPAHRRRVIGVAFSPDGRILATGGEEGTAKLWEAATHREIATLKGHLRSVHSRGISPDSRRLATGNGDEEAVELWDLHTHQELITLSGEGSMMRLLAFSPDGNRIVRLSSDRQLHTWSAPSCEEIATAGTSTP